MWRVSLISLFILTATFFVCCESKTKLAGTPLYEPEYADHFLIESYGEYSSILEVKNPWQGAENISSQLFISRNGEKPSEDFSGTVVSAPLKTVVCMSSSYVAFIDALGETGSVRGVSGAPYYTNETIRKGYADGTIRDVGYDSNLNYELLTSIKPDLVMIFGVANENTAMTDKLRELHIPVVYIADYLENTPLGKAEWLVAFGELYDKRETAETIFNGIAGRYNETLAIVENIAQADKPKVMLNVPYNDKWFVPGDKSYLVELIRAAGGEYIFAGSDNDVSRVISIETAYVGAKEADVWLNPNQMRTLREIIGLNEGFKDINAVKNERVYNSTKRSTPEGGSDFWESGALRADLVVKDLFSIFYPGIEPDHELYYFEQLH